MRLRTLGGLTLEGSSLTRPKPLLVLAYLALEGPTPRRRLAELFFGDATDPRDSLSTALRHLRRTHAIREVDAEHVSSLVACDVDEVLQAFDAYRYDAVVAAYHGPFLASVDASVGVEAEEWLFTVREVIASRVRTAHVHCARVAFAAAALEDARTHVMRALNVAGAGELETDELDTLTGLARDTGLPEAAKLRALATAHGLDPERSHPALGRAGIGDPSPSLHRSTRFVGRGDELRMIDAWIRDPEVRVVSVFGIGGVGKTRLVTAFAQRAAEAPDQRDRVAVCVVGLESAAALEDSLRTIAARLALPPTAGASVEALCTAIGQWCMLLVLDNVEHVDGLPDAVSQLIRRCSGLTVVVTSRRRLGVESEHSLELRGLPLAGGAARPSQAARLFLDRAARVGFGGGEEEHVLDAIEALCRDLEGHPLGIELAAGMTRVMSVDLIRSELAAGLDVLDHGPRDAPERHRALRSTLEPSWSVLAEPDRGVLAKLSMFPADFSFGAAAAVGGATLARITGFADAALVRTSNAGLGRFSLHPVVRSFALERVTPGDRDAFEVRYIAFFASVVADSASRAMSEPIDALDLIERDEHNVATAASWAHRRGDDAALVAIVEPLFVELDFAQSRGCRSELLLLARHVADWMLTESDFRRAAALLIKLANAQRTSDEDARGAIRTYRAALDAAVMAGDDRTRVMIHAILGALSFTSDGADALEHFRLAHAIADRIEDDLATCEVLQREAFVAGMQRDWTTMRSTSERAYGLARAYGSSTVADVARSASLQYFSLHNVAVATSRLGAEDDALELRRRCLALAEERGNERWQAYAHEELALANAERGDARAARAHALRAAELYERTRDFGGQRSIASLQREWGLSDDA